MFIGWELSHMLGIVDPISDSYEMYYYKKAGIQI